MLRIAEKNKITGEKIDLKELEKFNLEFNEKNGRYEYIERHCDGFTYININSWNRKILFEQKKEYDHICLKILYDLIVAGYVEKVEEEK